VAGRRLKHALLALPALLLLGSGTSLEDQVSECEAGDAGACVAAAERLTTGDGVPHDLVQAHAMWTLGCDAGDAVACTYQGRGSIRATGTDRDTQAAYDLLSAACETDEVDRACAWLGYFYDNGVVVSRDDDRAVKLYRSACEAGDGAGCVALGDAYRMGDGVGQDNGVAETLYKKSCDVGYAEGCWEYGSVYERGQGANDAPEDSGRGIELLAPLCDAGDLLACNSLAVRLADPDRGELDTERAMELLERGCDVGLTDSCVQLATLLYRDDEDAGIEADKARSLELAEAACETGMPAGCANLALHKVESGARAEAAALYRDACDEGLGYACSTVAYLEPTDGCDLQTRACDLGSWRGCTDMAMCLQDNGGQESDWRSRVEGTCAQGYGNGCVLLGLTEAGRFAQAPDQDEGPRDVAAATGYLERACELEDADGCTFLGLYLLDGSLTDDGDGDSEAAFPYLEQGCEQGGENQVCVLTALILWSGEVGRKDDARAEEILHDTCVAGSADGCRALLGLWLQSMDDETAYGRATDLCDDGIPRGCIMQGEMLLTGQGVGSDKKAGVALLEQACVMGDEDACYLATVKPRQLKRMLQAHLENSRIEMSR
jgi:TPR repeat protein